MMGASIDLEDYRQATTEALQGEPLAAKRAMLIRSLAAIPKGTCDAPFFGDLLRNRDPVVYPVAVRLVVKSCPNPLATFPGQLAPSGDVIGDLIRYNAVAPNALHSMFDEKLRQNDMIASQLILAAGSSSDPSWAPEILPFLGSTDYWVRQAAFRALADLGYKGDEPEAAAANENHPLVIADAVRWVWMKDSDRGREMALKNVSALPIYSLVQMLERPSEKEEQRLFEATLVGAAPLKRNAACVLAAVLSASELTRVLNSHDLQVQDAAYGCIPFRTDAINSISGREFSSTRPDSLEFRLHRRQDLLNTCNVEVARFPKWAQQWRRKLCVAWDPSLALSAN